MNTTPQLQDPDAFYAALVAAQDGMDEADSAAFLARLVLLLANQLGRQDLLLACIAAAQPATSPSAEMPAQGAFA